MPTGPHTRTRIVQSRHNARVKELRAALARPSAKLIGLEGLHLVEEALSSGIEVQTIFVRIGAEALLESLGGWLEGGLRGGLEGGLPAPEVLFVPEEVLRWAVTTETPQAIAALAVPSVFMPEQVFPGGRGAALVVVLAGLQDPGNVGAIVRSVEAFGATGVLALPGTASVWNAKSLRASMGSAFRLPVVALGAQEAFAALVAHGVRSLATVAPGHASARTVREVDLCADVALWIGNEGAGLAEEVVERCEGAVTIACPGPVESLNAGIAAGVLLYEASRQRAAVSALRVGKGHPNQV